jgi:hypothetical protein
MQEPQEEQFSIKFMRMNTGEDIISEVSVTSDTGGETMMQFRNPLKISYGISQTTGNIVITLMYWIYPKLCNNQIFPIYANDVITIGDPSDNMIQYYINTINKLESMYSSSDNTSSTDTDYDKYSFMEDDDELDDDCTEEDLNKIKNSIDDVIKKKRKLH